MNLKDEINNVEISISKSPFKGKTKHPGLGYFNANEWLQFAEMHFRHHFKTKEKNRRFLKNKQILAIEFVTHIWSINR
ncbi:MAG: hypothetical protein WKG06_33175 [Segetibacter sp.]